MKVTTAVRDFDLCFMTPTWRGDLDRFVMLRESLVAYGHGAVPHYALVNTEDLPLLLRQNLSGVIPVTTAELLPGELEQGRLRYLNAPGGRAWKRLQRSLNKRLGWFPDAVYYGWQIQQALKLEAPLRLPHDVFVAIDSDIVVCGRFELSEFVPDGRVVLYERHVDLLGKWYPSACRLLDVPLKPAAGMYDYVSQPFVFERESTRALQQWLEQRYQRPWYRSLFAQPLGTWSEFMTYGVFVRRHLGLQGFTPRLANCENFWLETEDQRRAAGALIPQVFADPRIKYLVLQADDHGRWPLSRFRPWLDKELRYVVA